jgi:L,D-transpeptidase ErfK/SrfK
MEQKQLAMNKWMFNRERLLRMDKALHTSVKAFFAGKKQLFLLLIFVLSFFSIFCFFILAITFVMPTLQEMTFGRNSPAMNNACTTDSTESRILKEKLNTEISALQKKLDKKTPVSSYLVVNTSKNKFLLYKDKKVLGKGRCSTGSYILLSKGDEQQWIFKTPRGVFQIRGKTVSPVWVKPDWALVEEGLPVPSPTHRSRYEYGVLGDYALSLGQGYLIHGTIYQRFLGLPVTHGCIRLNDDDLKLVYQCLTVGSKVYIY